MSTLDYLPVPVITLEEVPGSKEGAAIFVAILIERDSRGFPCLLLHEKVHIAQQWGLIAVLTILSFVFSLPLWLGPLAGVVLYSAGWSLWPWFRNGMEEWADEIQRECIADLRQLPRNQLLFFMKARLTEAWNDGDPNGFMFSPGDVNTWHNLLFEEDEDE